MKKLLFLGTFLLVGLSVGQEALAQSAISDTQCTQAGGTCRTSWGGDGCYNDTEQVLRGCNLSNGATGNCCITKEIMCTRYTTGGTVRQLLASREASCNQGERVGFNVSSSRLCCIANSSETSAPGGATPTGRTCASPNTCVNSASGCPASAPNNVSSSTPCAEPGRICCSATNPSSGGGGGNGGGANTTTPLTQDNIININVSNPLRYDNVEGVLTSIMNSIKGIVATLAILMIVIGGLMYIFSFGNPDSMKRAKFVIIAALVGLAIVIAAPAFLREISAILGWDNAPAIEGGTQLTLTQIAQRVLNFLLSIIGVLALIMLIISGLMYITSAGNETRMKQARAIFTASLIGIAVAMASLVLVSAVARFFI